MLEKSRARRMSNRWGWRSLIVFFAGLAYAGSLAVQLTWHGLGSQYEGLVSQYGGTEVEGYVGWSLAVALLTIWWNPKWQYKLKDEGRLVGLGAYYRLQLTVLLIRFGAWISLTEFSRVQSMLHSVFMIATVVLSGMAMWTVKIDTTPLVNWDYEQPTLVTKTQYVPPPRPSFQIGSLAPTTISRQWKPPTPPNEDTMDWAPSYTFDEVKQPRYRDTGPSPFHSTALPAEAKAVGLPPGHFDKRDRLPERETGIRGIAEPKFFPPDVDTGLESIFGQVFSLHDRVEERSQARESRSQAGEMRSQAGETYVEASQVGQTDVRRRRPRQASLLSAAFLLMMLVLWSISDVLAVAFPPLRAYVIGFAVLVSISTMRRDVLAIVTAIEVSGLIWIGLNDPTIFCDRLGAGVLSMLALQQIWVYAQPEQAALVLDRKISNESLQSVDSIETTSTAPAWKTPKRPSRFEMDRLVL